MRIEHVDDVALAVLESEVRADARLFKAANRVDLPVRDVRRHVRIVMVHLEVSVRQDGEAGRVDLRLWSELVRMRREIESLVHVALAERGQRLLEHFHEPLELRLAGAGAWMSHVRADRSGFDLLQTHDIRQRIERGKRPRDPLHGRARARDPPRRVPEVANVVGHHP